MTPVEFQMRYHTYRGAVDAFLNTLFTRKTPYGDLLESMRYSLLAGGKRLRPVLALEFARLGGMEWQNALPIACSMELMHTYSLIHDDLPCMDDDNLRRGKPTNHRVYGETLAVLAGDALQSEAFRLILTAPEISADHRAECAQILAEAAGADGMVGGQVLDTLHMPHTREELMLVNRLKTGAMIRGAAEIGCAAAGANGTLRSAAGTYAEEIGTAFQIQDDLLDVVGEQSVFGKPIGSDKEEGKVTFVDLLGVEGCRRAVREYTGRAETALAAVGDSIFLRRLAEMLAERGA